MQNKSLHLRTLTKPKSKRRFVLPMCPSKVSQHYYRIMMARRCSWSFAMLQELWSSTCPTWNTNFQGTASKLDIVPARRVPCSFLFHLTYAEAPMFVHRVGPPRQHLTGIGDLNDRSGLSIKENRLRARTLLLWSTCTVRFVTEYTSQSFHIVPAAVATRVFSKYGGSL